MRQQVCTGLLEPLLDTFASSAKLLFDAACVAHCLNIQDSDQSSHQPVHIRDVVMR